MSSPWSGAIEPAERNCGLMFREEMAADHGMVFDFQTERQVSFWMRNTYISLDMVFIRDGGEVLNVARNTTTLSDESVPSADPVRYVLELIAGTAERIGLEPGDMIDLDRAEGMTAGNGDLFPRNLTASVGCLPRAEKAPNPAAKGPSRSGHGAVW